MIATPVDIPHLVAMAGKFYAKSGFAFEFCEHATAAVFGELIETDAAYVGIVDNGMICGIISPVLFGPSWTYAQELLWWSEGGHGLKLLADFEDWARDNNANEVRMGSLDNLKPADTILTRRGYSRAEISYSKELN